MDDAINSVQSISLGLDLKSQQKIGDAHADVIVHAEDGISIQAHKSILVRCPYFAAMLHGDWIENQTSSINIIGYSSVSLKFVLSQLYEPTIKFKDDADLVEIFALADMLGLQELVDAVITKIVKKLCHNFHKPCPECIPGVLSCLQLALRFNLLDLEHRCVSWISKHFVKVWKSKPFANLPKPFLAKCLESVLSSININTVMSLLLESQQLKDTLPSVKWTEPISNMIQQLREKLLEFLQLNFSDAFETPWFKNLRDCDEWHIKCVQQQLSDASETLPVEQACRAYIKIDCLMENNQSVDETYRENVQYLEFLANVNQVVEKRIIKQVAMATKCPSWKELSKTKQTAIMQLGFFSPIENNPQQKAVKSRTTVRRNGSLNEPRRPEINQRPLATQPPLIERTAERSSFQRNVLRSTAPRLRNVNESYSESSGSTHTNPVPRRPAASAIQRPTASSRPERRPWK